METDTLLTKNEVLQHYKAYKRRWYVLGVFSLLAFMQMMEYNTWGPIADSSQRVFGWSEGEISLMSSWGCLAIVIGTLPQSWYLDSKGLRAATLLGAGFMVLGTGIRCLIFDKTVTTWLTNAGQFILGLGGPVMAASPPVLSAAWFPAHQRTTSTAIAETSVFMGMAGSFLIGPYIVSNHNYTNLNTTDKLIYEKEELNSIKLYMYLQFGVTLFLFLAVIVYFPAHPPTAPSTSAATGRLGMRAGIRKMVSNKNFWLLSMSYSLCGGVYVVWLSVFADIVKDKGMSQKEAGWLGFYPIAGAVVTSIVLARFTDTFSGHSKAILLSSNVIMIACFAWFTLNVEGLRHYSKASVYVATITSGIMFWAPTALWYELICECMYPVPEAWSSGALTFLANLIPLPFFYMMLIPSISINSWINWAVTGTIGISVPMLCIFKPNYNRLDLDDHQIPEDRQDNVHGTTIQ